MKWVMLLVIKQLAPPSLCSIDVHMGVKLEGGAIRSQELKCRKSTGLKMRFVNLEGESVVLVGSLKVDVLAITGVGMLKCSVWIRF
jgi:hypothetical protein